MTISPSSTQRAGKLRAQRLEQLGEVAVQRFFVAALDQDLVAVAKDERAKPVPLGFEDPVPAGRQFTDALGQHRQERRVHGKIHTLSYTAHSSCDCWKLRSSPEGEFSPKYRVNESFLNMEVSPSSLRFLERQGGMTASLNARPVVPKCGTTRTGHPLLASSLSLVGKGQREQRFLLHFVRLG